MSSVSTRRAFLGRGIGLMFASTATLSPTPTSRAALGMQDDSAAPSAKVPEKAHRQTVASTARLRDRIEGMLIGSLIGDAAGGPIEFVDAARIEKWAPSIHRWQPDERLNDATLDRLSSAFRLLSYQRLRPEPAAYGPWAARAPAGTLTDDTRHKVVFMSALARATEARRAIEPADVARAYLEFEHHPSIRRNATRRRLCHEWLLQLRPCCRWLLGERTPPNALPPQRLWGGVPTVMGQMALLPVAAIYAGRPRAAYKAAYRLGFFDNGAAKDINSAVVAGLAFALEADPSASISENDGISPPSSTWPAVCRCMLATDPYRYDQVPWVERPLRRWLGVARSVVRQSDRSPSRLFAMLERRLMARTWWEAHTVFATVAAMLTLCSAHPLAAMQLALEFGHDTDSTAQLLGAFVGALGGTSVFPAPMRRAVSHRLQTDEGESLTLWVERLLAARQLVQNAADRPPARAVPSGAASSPP